MGAFSSSQLVTVPPRKELNPQKIEERSTTLATETLENGWIKQITKKMTWEIEGIQINDQFDGPRIVTILNSECKLEMNRGIDGKLFQVELSSRREREIRASFQDRVAKGHGIFVKSTFADAEDTLGKTYYHNSTTGETTWKAPSKGSVFSNHIAHRLLHYETLSGNIVTISNEVNYFDYLGLRDGNGRAKSNFKSLINNADRSIRAKVSLGFHAYYSMGKTGDKRCNYIATEFDGLCICDFSNPFVLCAVGASQELKALIDKDKSLLRLRDACGASLLYIACRGGFYDVAQMLLHQPEININEPQNTGSTPLHVACYYGHTIVVSLLLSSGASVTHRNQAGSTPEEESSPEMVKYIRSCQDNSMHTFLSGLVSKNMVQCIETVVFQDKIIGFRAVSNLKKSLQAKLRTWSSAWHGTKFQHMESILINGLKKPGSILPGGDKIAIPRGHIPTGIRIAGVDNWADAIFVSPSIAYSSHPAYAERLVANGSQWCCLINVKIQSGRFKAFPSTVLKYEPLTGEPEAPEYRVEDEAVDSIMRVDSNGSCIVTAAFFLDAAFLENTSLTFDQIQTLFDRNFN